MEYGYPHMPCDGVLLGTRVMACKEAFTCDQAKDLIQAASGVESQKEWEKSYTDDAGGVITVLSELGEPIHVVNNRGSQGPVQIQVCTALWRGSKLLSQSTSMQSPPGWCWGCAMIQMFRLRLYHAFHRMCHRQQDVLRANHSES